LQDLSPSVFEALLSSEGLQLKTENERFWLLLSWVEAQSEESEEGKQVLFTRLAQHLSFAAMDPGYILLLVSKHPRIIAAGLQLEVMRASLIYANLAGRTDDDLDVLYERSPGFSVPKKHLSRSPWPLSTATWWTVHVSFNAADATAATSGQKCRKVVGLVAGLPWYIELQRRADQQSEVGVYTMCDLPFDGMTFGLGAGFFFHYRIEWALGTPRRKTFPFMDLGKRTWTELDSVGDGFGTWDDVFREESEWLVDGELHARMTVTTMNEQSPSKLLAARA
jgi:hypothetical protein